MTYAPANRQGNAPIPPSSLMSYFDSSRTGTPHTAPLARPAGVAATASGVCAHDTNVPFPRPEQPPAAAAPAQGRSRSDSIASSYKQYFAQNGQRALTHSEANGSRSASMASSVRGDVAYPQAPPAAQTQRAAPYPHEPSKPVRESATPRQAAAAHAYPAESEDWDHAEEPVMRDESPLDTQAAEEPMMAAPPRNAYNPNASNASRGAHPAVAAAAPTPARPAQTYATSEDDGARHTPYTPRDVGPTVTAASAPRSDGTPIRRAAAPATSNDMHDVVLPEHSNSYMEPGTPRSDRGTPRRKSDARRLNPHSNSYDPVYASNTPRSEDDYEDNDMDQPVNPRAMPQYPAYESLGAARQSPSQPPHQPPPQPQSQQVTPRQQTYPSHYQPRAAPVASSAAPASAGRGGAGGGAEDPRQQYPSQYRSLYRPEVRPKNDAAPSFPFNRSESSVVADSTTTSERGYRPPFDLSPRRPEDYVADDMDLDDEDVNCTFQPNLDRRAVKDREAAEEEGSDATSPVFSRLYADAQRVNRLREEREQALELQRQMRRGEVPYDSEALRTAGLSVNEVDETELAIGASRRATLRLPDESVSDAGDEEREDAGSQAGDAQRRRRSSMGRKKVDFEVFERLSKPQAVTPKFQRAQEMKEQAVKDEERRREEAKRDALENIGHYDWPLPAKSFTMADLRKQNAVFAK